jgi:hypothetical protein
MDYWNAPSDVDWDHAAGNGDIWAPDPRPTPGPEELAPYGASWWGGHLVCPQCSAAYTVPPGLDTRWVPLSRSELLFFRALPGTRCRVCDRPGPEWPVPPDDTAEDAS